MFVVDVINLFEKVKILNFRHFQLIQDGGGESRERLAGTDTDTSQSLDTSTPAVETTLLQV